MQQDTATAYHPATHTRVHPHNGRWAIQQLWHDGTWYTHPEDETYANRQAAEASRHHMIEMHLNDKPDSWSRE